MPYTLSVVLHPGYQVQATSHRWMEADIYHYEVTLRAWNGTAYAELDPPLTVVVPQKAAAKTQARFSHLRPGARYQATIVAKGNVGGTSPSLALNAEAPTRVEWAFDQAQDLESVRSLEATVRLDPVPFSGRLTLRPTNAPADTDAYALQLEDATTGAVRYAATYTATQTMVVSRVRVGLPYRVRLSALAQGTVLAEAPVVPIDFDPEGQDLEQDQDVPLSF